MNTSWNEAEEQALSYLPHRAQLLYLRGMRRYMNYETGIVGEARKISFQMFVEVLEVNPERGSTEQRYQPSLSEIRASIAQLERAGLIVKITKKNKFDSQRFLLPLASKGSIRPNEERQRNDKRGTTREHPVFTRPTQDMSDKGEIGRNDNHQGTGNKYSLSLTPVPENFTPNDQHRYNAQLHAIQNVDEEALKFIAYYQANGELQANWDSKFNLWLMKAKEYKTKELQRSATNATRKKPASLIDRVKAANGCAESEQQTGNVIDGEIV